jgi:hypothetical protein
MLTHDVLVELGDDALGGDLGHARYSSGFVCVAVYRKGARMMGAVG